MNERYSRQESKTVDQPKMMSECQRLVYVILEIDFKVRAFYTEIAKDFSLVQSGKSQENLKSNIYYNCLEFS